MRASFARQKKELPFMDNISYGFELAKKNFRRGQGAWLILTVCLCAACAFCGCGKESAVRHSLADTAMGTLVNLTFYSGDLSEEELRELEDSLLEEIRGKERELLSWREETSEVFRVQQEMGPGGAFVSEELFELLRECRKVEEDSDGAFSPALGALTRLWNMDGQALLPSEETRVPSEEEIRAALGHCGPDHMKLTEGRLFLEEGTFLDLGAVGKGYMLDRIRKELSEKASASGKSLWGVASLGGSVLTYGEKPDGTPWKVAVADPEEPGETIGYLELKGSWCVSTSGDYERFFEKDGVRYHHILDPSTGYPAKSGLRSVTILSESGFLSDALSTACFVLGQERGTKLAEKYGAGILTVDEGGEISCNEKMEGVFRLWRQDE